MGTNFLVTENKAVAAIMDEDTSSPHSPQEPNVSVNISQENGNFCPFSKASTSDDARTFHIIDEVENESDSSTSDTDSDIPDEEIERMLDDALLLKKRNASEAGLDDDNDINPFEEKEKVVLIEKGHNHFDILPEGWIEVTHNSGMPLYLHKSSRVCTLSKPYFLGTGSVRRHNVPLSSVPCLSYRTALSEESEKDPTTSRNEIPKTRIESATESTKTRNLTPEQLTKYCESVFKFTNIRVMRFKSWIQRRKFSKKRRRERELQRPTLPDNIKLITFPIAEQNRNGLQGPVTKREWTMNPSGKSYVCILHEFLQHALKKQPSYKFTELENATTPYSATISINGMQYGVGYGTSKKHAKSEAARATLEILIPEIRSKITLGEPNIKSKKSYEHDLTFFDDIKIEDPRVAEFCTKTTEPSPHDILLTCLQRNFGLGNIEIDYKGNTLKHQKNEFTMTVGKHKATVICSSKRDGKQRASQAILQALHPHITSWGSLLRLYGSRSIKSFKEKKMEEQEITLLQSKAAINSPNFAILEKLRTELLKLKDSRDLIVPIGVLTPKCEALPTLSCSNLNKLDL